jgi:hypothetical protein
LILFSCLELDVDGRDVGESFLENSNCDEDGDVGGLDDIFDDVIAYFVNN